MTSIFTAPGDALAVLRAHWYLRRVRHLGRRVRLRGRPVIRSQGSIIIDDRVQLFSDVARIELGAVRGATLSIGARTLVNYGCSIAAITRVTIGERCLIGPHCMIIDSAFHSLDPEHRVDPPTAEPISIGKNVWLGARVVVLPGVTIGDDAVIGVGSIVTADVPPRTLAVGAPARVIRTL